MKEPKLAPNSRDVVGFDNHGFAGRYRRNAAGGWVPYQRTIPLFNDEDMMGWIELPRKVVRVSGDSRR